MKIGEKVLKNVDLSFLCKRLVMNKFLEEIWEYNNSLEICWNSTLFIIVDWGIKNYFNFSLVDAEVEKFDVLYLRIKNWSGKFGIVLCFVAGFLRSISDNLCINLKDDWVFP